MGTNVNSAVFSRQMYTQPHTGRSAIGKASVEFAAILTSMLARRLRETGIGGEGLMGGGTAGDIYGTFFDQIIGEKLANSAAIKPLVEAVDSSLEVQSTVAAKSSLTLSATAHGGSYDEDGRGPVLVPPSPTPADLPLPPPEL
jgi:hypothetical protein